MFASFLDMRFTARHILFPCGYLVLSLMYSSIVFGDKKPGDHFHVKQSCINCHSEGIDVDSILRSNNNVCLNCHTRKQIKTKLNSPRPISHSTKTSPEAQMVMGLQIPIRSQQSRLGDKPNSMVSVPAGKFLRGTNHRLFDEGPQHTAQTKAFHIDIYEVTNAQYKKFNDATKRRSPNHFVNRTYPEGMADHPVTYVSWEDANDYCLWAGKRLPTDIEWEKAARGTDGREYPWGNKFELDRANMPLRWAELNEFGGTTPVGGFEKGKSPYGAYDMTGNVWEWTNSWYEAYPGSTTKSENYGQRYKTLKGGSWFDCSFYKCGISAPVYNRAFFSKRTKNDTFGFRCAKDTK